MPPGGLGESPLCVIAVSGGVGDLWTGKGVKGVKGPADATGGVRLEMSAHAILGETACDVVNWPVWGGCEKLSCASPLKMSSLVFNKLSKASRSWNDALSHPVAVTGDNGGPSSLMPSLVAVVASTKPPEEPRGRSLVSWLMGRSIPRLLEFLSATAVSPVYPGVAEPLMNRGQGGVFTHPWAAVLYCGRRRYVQDNPLSRHVRHGVVFSHYRKEIVSFHRATSADQRPLGITAEGPTFTFRA